VEILAVNNNIETIRTHVMDDVGIFKQTCSNVLDQPPTAHDVIAQQTQIS